MKDDLALELASLANNLVGKTCFAVSAGGATGSRFNLHFGGDMGWAADPKNPRLSDMLKDRPRGEFRVQVGCASWRLDSALKPITSCTDLASTNGPMIQALNLLRGREVTAAEVTKPGLDLVLTFGEEFVLRVFCDQFERDCDNYSLAHEDEYLSVLSRSNLSVWNGDRSGARDAREGDGHEA